MRRLLNLHPASAPERLVAARQALYRRRHRARLVREEHAEDRPVPAHPGVWFPPPVLYVLAFTAGLALDREYPMPLGADVPRDPLLLGGAALGVLGVALLLWGLLTFRLARTRILPNKPARRIVTHGPYRLTRNPMYVGLALLYLGLSLYTGVLWTVPFLPVALALVYWLVIRREERYLTAAFPGDYAAYCRRVHRWL